MHRSIATIDAPEFINLQPLDINKMMSKCEIKVLYIGENRNHSYITKEVASNMAKTLRGAPIVGYYKQDKEDFGDHGDRIILDDEGIKFECLTKPYGFVAPDANVWFQKFEEEDDFGNPITREYLMTTGYLWTGQYKECTSVIENGKNQSMELDEESMNGHWATNAQSGMEFFIIDDAMFSKLCILGDDVEPCFEGARITAPEVSASFSKVDNNFKKTLFSMMQELKFALEGGQKMLEEEKKEEKSIVEEKVKETETETIEQPSETSDTIEETLVEEIPSGEFKKEEDDDKVKEEKDDKEEEENKEEDDEEKKKYSLLEKQFEELNDKYSKMEKEYQALVAFKAQIEDEKKDALINSFYMLSAEDKADVIKNKAQYSLEDIEAKLSIICVRKKVNFDLDNSSKNEKEIEEKEENVVTYSLNDVSSTSIPAWVSAVKNTQKNK